MIWIAAAVIGAATGLATTLLLYALTWVTAWRAAHETLYYALAPAGLLTGVIYHYFGRTSAGGTKQIIAEIRHPRAPVPWPMAPLILVTTTLTHLVGGSAGREGSAVQMGGALAERVAKWFGVTAGDRRQLLTAGLGAGFAAAIGAPLAGALFGLEVTGRRLGLPSALVAAGAAVAVTHALHAPHGAYGPVDVDLTEAWLWPLTLGGGLAFGLTARVFNALTHSVERAFARLPPMARPALGGVALTLAFLGGGLTRYAGLGLDVIAESLRTPVGAADPALKTLLTALTLGAGFRGGEFIPLVFVGATLGSALGTLWPRVPLAALGFGAVFGAAANVPLACAVMVAEIFGWRLFPPALLCGHVACAVSGLPGIYAARARPRGPSAGPKRLGSSTELS